MKATLLRELEKYKELLDQSKSEIHYELNLDARSDRCRICSAAHEPDFCQQFIHTNTQVDKDGRSFCRFSGCRACWTRIFEQHRVLAALIPPIVKLYSKTCGGIIDARVTHVIPTFADFDPRGPFFGIRAICPDGSRPIVGMYGRTPVTEDALMIRVEYEHDGTTYTKICPVFGINGIDAYNGW